MGRERERRDSWGDREGLGYLMHDKLSRSKYEGLWGTLHRVLLLLLELPSPLDVLGEEEQREGNEHRSRS